MWLVYLRYDVAGAAQTYHVSAANKAEAYALLELAREHGPAPAARLAEYAVFYSQRTIRAKEAPNFHMLTDREFRRRFGASGACAESPAGAAT